MIGQQPVYSSYHDDAVELIATTRDAGAGDFAGALLTLESLTPSTTFMRSQV